MANNLNELTWEFYQDTKKEWRWRAKAKNGKTVANSGEGFASKQGAINNAKFSGYK